MLGATLNPMINTYGIFISDGTQIGDIEGDKLEFSDSGVISVWAGGKIVAVFPSVGFAVVRESQL